MVAISVMDKDALAKALNDPLCDEYNWQIGILSIACAVTSRRGCYADMHYLHKAFCALLM